MKHDFENSSRVVIDPGPPAVVTSGIDVGGIDDGTVEDVDVAIDIDHSWTGDLVISLLNPSGQRVVLADRRGGSQDHFRTTTFDSDAPTSILNAVAAVHAAPSSRRAIWRTSAIGPRTGAGRSR